MMDVASPPAGWDGILAEGENILWQGRPDSALDFSGFWTGQTWFALFYTGFSVFWIGAALSMTNGIGDGFGQVLSMVFPLFGLPFLWAGLQMLVGRFWTDARRRRNSHYTLTNLAAYIGVETGGKRSLDRYDIGPDTAITLEDGALGSIWFAKAVYRKPFGVPRSGQGFVRGGATKSEARVGFERLADARLVYALMRKAQLGRATAEGKSDG